MLTIRELREANGRTLRETAVLVGLSWDPLAAVERGERRLSGESRLRYVRAFDLSADECKQIVELTPFPEEVPA